MARALLRHPPPPPRPSRFSTSSGTSQGHRPPTDHQSDHLQRHHDQLRPRQEGFSRRSRKGLQFGFVACNRYLAWQSSQAPVMGSTTGSS
ncbi:hypothetical protein BRADI_3g55366v3 [Brachypodium distachyon]|uniref:Uncharacterized protein n=1 Tax=Brachypodium distachyon TaxID=15368 RepID=A0A0Q3MAK9_BRADI|nr:hypothetical protein BRADI_3g55366v3 [Brachypodium distachyon]